MLKLDRKIESKGLTEALLQSGQAEPLELHLTIDQRIRSRLRVSLSNGEEAGLDLPRGETLRGGEYLQASSGEVVRVVSAPETLSVVRAETPLLMARLCYHLGNRHVPLEVAPDYLSYQHDHVLDDLVRGLGGQVSVEERPFEPEAGAYGGQSHGHSHEHHSH